MSGPAIEGQQKGFVYKSDIASAAWTSLAATDFTLMNTGNPVSAGFFAEVTALNVGDKDIYISFGRKAVVNIGGDDLVNTEAMRAVGVELKPGAYYNIELTGTFIDEVSLRCSANAAANGKVQLQAIFLVR